MRAQPPFAVQHKQQRRRKERNMYTDNFWNSQSSNRQTENIGNKSEEEKCADEMLLVRTSNAHEIEQSLFYVVPNRAQAFWNVHILFCLFLFFLLRWPSSPSRLERNFKISRANVCHGIELIRTRVRLKSRGNIRRTKSLHISVIDIWGEMMWVALVPPHFLPLGNRFRSKFAVT